jgi:hypothetical protein
MRNIWIGLVTSPLIYQAAQCQETVPKGPLRRNGILATLPVLALRKLPVDEVIVPAKNKDNTWMVSTSAAVMSAYLDKQISRKEWVTFSRFESSEQFIRDDLPLLKGKALKKSINF